VTLEPAKTRMGERMKLLFLTDSHIRGNNPASRIDNYPEALKKKHVEIGQIIKDDNIDVVIHGGDIFHSFSVADSLKSEYIKVLKSWEVPIYCIAGSHDVVGYNEKTISRTALGVLIAADTVKLLGSIPTEIHPGIFAVGINHSYRLDENPQNYSLEKDDKTGILIEVVHGMVVDKPFFDDYTLIEDIKTEADVFLSGHFHLGWKPQKVNDTLFINPGSLGRVENVRRVFPPSVCILNIEGKNIDYEIVPLKCVAPSKDIFKSVTKLGNETSEKILEFMKTLSQKTGDLEKHDAKSLVLKIAKEEEVSDSVVEKALTIIDEVMFND